VQGNFIGTDVTGTADLGNHSSGVDIAGAPGNSIGGAMAGARNVISGNDQSGVRIQLTDLTGNLVQGNFIGTQVDGTSALGNSSHGVHILNMGSNNTIGGTSEGEDNVIVYNGGDGVRVDGYPSSTTGNSILSNSIHSNSGKGIENINGGNNELAPPIVDSVGVSLRPHRAQVLPLHRGGLLRR